MAWARKSGSAAKYRSAEHRAYCAALKRELQRLGFLTCVAPECVLPSRVITNPNGRDPDGLTAGHESDGVTYRGPEHRLCNVRDGAQRGNARSHGLLELTVRRTAL